jgi:CPA2 family monovalent cation:H+ antiporter-2
VIFGAFLAGMLVSETQYGHQVIADLVPLREPFVALFFVSVGILLDLNHFAEHWPLILALVLGVMVIKFFVGTLSALGLRYEIRTAVLTGLLLAQIGEFSFVIAQGALKGGVLDAYHYQFFLSISIVTMLLSPTLMFFAPQAVTMLEHSDKLVRFLQVPVTPKKANKRVPKRREHVIIIGLGVIGQHLTRLLGKNNIPCIGIENDSRLAHRLSSEHDLAVIFGDGAKREILEAADLSHAKLVVVAINDANWTPRVVASIRHLRPEVEIIVRCQYFKELQKFKSHSKNDFVVGEAEMAIAFSEKVLQHFGVDQESISASVEETRSGLLN